MVRPQLEDLAQLTATAATAALASRERSCLEPLRITSALLNLDIQPLVGAGFILPGMAWPRRGRSGIPAPAIPPVGLPHGVEKTAQRTELIS